MNRTRSSLQSFALAVSAVVVTGCVSTLPVHDDTRGDAVPSQAEANTATRLPKNAAARVEAQARYAAGLAYELRRETDKALEEFIKSVEADPTNEDLALEVSRRLLLVKDARAMTIGKLAADQPNASAIAHSHLALLYANEGRHQEAERAARKAIELAPDTLLCYYNLYTLHLNQNAAGQALAILNEAARRPVTTPDYWLDLAELYANFARARPEQRDAVNDPLLRCLRRADELGVENPLRRQKLADGYALAGQTTRAAEIFLGLLETHADDPRIRDTMRQKLVALYLSNRDADNALEQLEELVRDRPDSPQVTFLLATAAAEKKDFAKAGRYFQKTLELKPDFEQAYYSLTAVLLESDDDEAAAELLTRARARYPRSFVAHYFSAVSFGRREQPGLAVEHYRQAEAIAQETMPERLDHVFFFQMGAQLERAKQFEEAAEKFKRCLGLKADFAEALNYLGYMWADLGVHLEEARQYIQKAVDLEPENPAYLDSLAWVLFKLDQPHLALTYMEEALKHQQKPDATLFDHLGDIQQAIGNAAAAREAWEKSLAVEDDPKVRQKLQAPATPANPTQE